MMTMHDDEVHSRLRAEYNAGTLAHGCQQATYGIVPSCACVYVDTYLRLQRPKMSEYDG